MVGGPITMGRWWVLLLEQVLSFPHSPPQNATGNWIKIVQRLPVRIAINPDQLRRRPLRLGLSLHASIDIRDTTGHVIPKKAPDKPLYETDVFQKQLQGVEEIIQQVIRENSG